MKKVLFFSVFSTLFLSSLFASGSDRDSTINLSEEELIQLYEYYLDSVSATLQYETGMVSIGDGLAAMQIPTGYKFLNGKDAEMVLTDLWGNPPSEAGAESLGMLFPADGKPSDDSIYVINITYSEDGFVDDSDAAGIDYEELLESMKEDTRLESEQRVEMGYPPIELIGWASPPYYDAEQKKLHWAKEISFDNSPEHTLNYNIRILGRRGYLMLNVIGEMYTLETVKHDIGPILASVDFQQGHRYADFNPGMDKVAAYGIGGLIAGKVLAKAGIFAKLGVLLLKFWKILAVAVVGAVAGLRRFFGGKAA